MYIIGKGEKVDPLGHLTHSSSCQLLASNTSSICVVVCRLAVLLVAVLKLSRLFVYMNE